MQDGMGGSCFGGGVDNLLVDACVDEPDRAGL
jgi:hypothetical protein